LTAGRGHQDRSRGLLAYPAQSNFTGVQHPLEWVELAHDRGYDVLLDAAAYLPTNVLDLTAVKLSSSRSAGTRSSATRRASAASSSGARR